MTYLQKALLLYDDSDSQYINLLKTNELGVVCEYMLFDDFLQNYKKDIDDKQHLLLACSDENIHKVLKIAVEFNYTLGLLPNFRQKKIIKTYNLSSNLQENIEIALNDDMKIVDLISVNGEYFHTKIYIGEIPFIKDMDSSNNIFSKVYQGVKQFFKIKLKSYDIKTANEFIIKTAASGLMISNQTQASESSNSLFKNSSMRDGKLSMMTISPSSVLEYFSFFISFIFSSKKLSNAVSFLKSDSFEITSDGKVLKYEVKANAISINAGEQFWELNPKVSDAKDIAKISNLPDEKERVKYIQKHIPFFSVASPERFKELFEILREDAKLDSMYLVLMLLSTMLAAIGLFANSSAVVIGAMVLAPLMTPIVAFSMGILRGENTMIKGALFKIFIGIIVAISASALISILLPQMNLTGELKDRINPNLLDLGVAIFSGIAAAYSKSHKSIRDSLAGVAIAVALVPPLATAGIGLGREEMYIFYGALLLFFTNLIGISLAATITFQFLGFSNAIKSKKSLIAISLLLVFISYPLYISYDKIVQKYAINTALKQSRFLIYDKYIIIKSVDIIDVDEGKIINLRLILREGLNRNELQQLKEKIQKKFNEKIYLRVETEFII